MGIEIPARLDDDVFHAAGDENFTLGAICAVAGVHPRAFALPDGRALRKQLFCRPGIPVVAARRRRPAEPQITFHALRRFLSGIVHDADFVSGHGRPGGHKGNGSRVILCGGNGATLAGEDFTLDAIDAWTPAERGNRDCQGRFSKPVDRQHCLAAKTIGRETCGKALQRFRIDRLRTVQRRAPGTQVEPFDVFVGNFPHA